ncbi:hypothetical protein B0A48_09962 [Cryoendolithus antarcticus]|uniref:Uncharacterized protein n=1 Tax=Cryoendolithus antarcticus TaxID=1507870 RepID=A0A1V8T375_9PEZI|nr:hypothetical protein B0A48_09962 [Cryoendolithus antarcticus]
MDTTTSHHRTLGLAKDMDVHIRNTRTGASAVASMLQPRVTRPASPAPVQALRVLLVRACKSWSQHTRLQRTHPTLAQILTATPDNTPLSAQTKSLALNYILEALPSRIRSLHAGEEAGIELSEINATLLAERSGASESVYMKGHFNKLLLSEVLRNAIDGVESELVELETNRMYDLGALRGLVMQKLGSWTAEEMDAVVSAMEELGLDVSSPQTEGGRRTREEVQGTRMAVDGGNKPSLTHPRMSGSTALNRTRLVNANKIGVTTSRHLQILHRHHQQRLYEHGTGRDWCCP